MVIGAFPLGKVAILGLKQITNPVGEVLKSFAKHNFIFKKFICAPAGQMINCVEARCKMRMLRLPQPKRIPRLPENMATDMGANILSEVFVIVLGIYLIYFEVSRQALKDKKKHDSHKYSREKLKSQICELNKLLDWQENEIRTMHQQISDYNRRDLRPI